MCILGFSSWETTNNTQLHLLQACGSAYVNKGLAQEPALEAKERISPRALAIPRGTLSSLLKSLIRHLNSCNLKRTIF